MVRTAWNKGIKIKDNPNLLNAHKKGVETRKRKGNYKANSGTFEKGQTRAHFPKGKKNHKLSEIRKLMFKKNQLSNEGKNNPMYGVKPNIAQKKALELGRGKKGKESNFWKGGITSTNKLIRSSIKYKQWRKTVFERDNYTCQECRTIGGELQVHHIKSFSKFPKLIYVVDNGITLCLKCHQKKHPELNFLLNHKKL